ncbi:hypothetical protein GMRT_10047 [Giardia muris]|uniref:Uncharacterized protein n=1 Tax=Giardia muris TaxID=5742 RepID=A0A4Z1SQA6_GIAMU|nr:hypothetical protein GMRT_10047 [Giardia muris]|eukprot:TNJ28034.1 hypothetical protein GMRT_10047 [Giardia muris]
MFPAEYRNVPEDFVTWLSGMRRDLEVGKRAPHALYSHIPSVCQIMRSDDPEVIGNVVPPVLHVITGRDPIPPVDTTGTANQTQPISTNTKTSAKTPQRKEKEAPTSGASFQLQLIAQDKILTREAYFFATCDKKTETDQFRSVRLFLLLGISYATSRAVLNASIPSLPTIMDMCVELAFRAILVNHITPTTCFELALQQYFATGAFVEVLCKHLTMLDPILWNIGLRFTEASIAGHEISPVVLNALPTDLHVGVPTILSCLAGFVRVFQASFEDLFAYLTRSPLYTFENTQDPSKAVIKGKNPVDSLEFNKESFENAEEARKILDGVVGTLIQVLERITESLDALLQLYQFHRFMIPPLIVTSLQDLLGSSGRALEHLRGKKDLLDQCIAVLQDTIGKREPPSEKLLAASKLLTGVERLPPTLDSITRSGSALYAKLAKDLLTLTHVCTRIFQALSQGIQAVSLTDYSQFSGTDESHPDSPRRDRQDDCLLESAGLTPALSEAIRMQPTFVCANHMALMAALTAIYHTPKHSGKLLQDDRAAIMGYCSFCILSRIWLREASTLPYSFKLTPNGSTALITTAAAQYVGIHKQIGQCLDLIEQKPIFRYDIPGKSLTYVPLQGAAISSLVLAAIAMDLLPMPDPSKAALFTAVSLPLQLPAVKPLLELPTLQVVTYLSVLAHMFELVKGAPFSPICLQAYIATLLDLNSAVLRIPTSEYAAQATQAEKKGETPPPTIDMVGLSLQKYFGDPANVTVALLTDVTLAALRVATPIDYSLRFKPEVFTSSTFKSVLGFARNTLALLDTDYVVQTGLNLNAALARQQLLTNLRLATFSTYFCPLELQPEKMDRTTLMDALTPVLQGMLDLAKTVLHEASTGSLSYALRTRHLASLSTRIQRFCDRIFNVQFIDISDALFEIYSSLCEGTEGGDEDKTLRDAESLTDLYRTMLATQRTSFEATTTAPMEKLLLLQTPADLPLCTNGIPAFLETRQMTTNITPPKTVLHTLKWQQALISTCVDVLMRAMQLEKVRAIFVHMRMCVTSSYTLACQYLTFTLLDNTYQDTFRGLLASLTLSDSNMADFLLFALQSLLEIQDTPEGGYLTVASDVVYLLDLFEHLLPGLADTPEGPLYSRRFFASKYDAIIQLGLYQEDEHDADLVEMIDNIHQLCATILQEPTPPSPTKETTAKGGKKEESIKPTISLSPESLSDIELLARLLVIWFTRLFYIEKITERDIEYAQIYTLVMQRYALQCGTTFITAKQQYSELDVLAILRECSAALTSPKSNGRGISQSIAEVGSRFVTPFADSLLLTLCAHIHYVVSQQCTFRCRPQSARRGPRDVEPSPELHIPYTSVITLYVVLLLQTCLACINKLTWRSFSHILLSVQACIAWFRAFSCNDVWSLMVPALEAMSLSDPLFDGFVEFCALTAQKPSGLTIVGAINTNLIVFSCCNVLWGSIKSGTALVQRGIVCTEDLEATILTSTPYRLRRCESSEDGEQIQPLPEDVVQYVTQMYIPLSLLKALLNVAEGRVREAYSHLLRIRLLYDPASYSLAAKTIIKSISIHISQIGQNVGPCLHIKAADTETLSPQQFLSLSLHPLCLDLYLRTMTSVQILLRHDLTSWCQLLEILFDYYEKDQVFKLEEKHAHKRQIVGLEPCQQLASPDDSPPSPLRKILQDYRRGGGIRLYMDSFFLQQNVATVCTIMECILSCQCTLVFGSQDQEYKVPTASEHMEGTPQPTSLCTPLHFVDLLAYHLLFICAPGFSFGSFFSDDFQFVLTHNLCVPVDANPAQLASLYDAALETLDFAERIFSRRPMVEVLCLTSLRMYLTSAFIFLGMPRISLESAKTSNDLSIVQATLMTLSGKRAELAAVIITVCLDILSRWAPESRLLRELRLILALAIERLVYVVLTIPEEIQDIAQGDFIKDRIVAMWLAETTATFGAFTVSPTTFCRDPRNQCVHPDMLIFMGNKALIDTGYATLRMATVLDVLGYKPPADDMERVVTTLQDAIMNSSEYSTQLLRLVCTEGPFVLTPDRNNYAPSTRLVVSLQEGCTYKENADLHVAEKKQASAKLPEETSPFALQGVQPALVAARLLGSFRQACLARALAVVMKLGTTVLDTISCTEYFDRTEAPTTMTDTSSLPPILSNSLGGNGVFTLQQPKRTDLKDVLLYIVGVLNPELVINPPSNPESISLTVLEAGFMEQLFTKTEISLLLILISDLTSTATISSIFGSKVTLLWCLDKLTSLCEMLSRGQTSPVIDLVTTLRNSLQKHITDRLTQVNDHPGTILASHLLSLETAWNDGVVVDFNAFQQPVEKAAKPTGGKEAPEQMRRTLVLQTQTGITTVYSGSDPAFLANRKPYLINVQNSPILEEPVAPKGGKRDAPPSMVVTVLGTPPNQNTLAQIHAALEAVCGPRILEAVRVLARQMRE